MTKWEYILMIYSLLAAWFFPALVWISRQGKRD